MNEMGANELKVGISKLAVWLLDADIEDSLNVLDVLAKGQVERALMIVEGGSA